MNAISALTERARVEAAREELAMDVPAYEEAGRDPWSPLLCGGSPTARIGFFGRDPGREEVRQMEPLIGAAGRLVRSGVHESLFGTPTADKATLQAMSRHVFFSNTVPYKPIGNKPWSPAVIARFRPITAAVLAQIWTGEHLITLGNDAFLWFGAPAEAFWERPDRYEASLTVDWPRRMTLHPLPHPSPANAIWHKKFPAMLAARLASLGLSATKEPPPVMLMG